MEIHRLYKRVEKTTTYNGKQYTLKVYEDTTEKQMQLALEIIYGPENNPVNLTILNRHGGYDEVRINNPRHRYTIEAIDLVCNWRDATPLPRFGFNMPK